MADRTPHEIARETLKLLAARKLAPSPANYQALYCEVSGVPNLPLFPAEPLRRIAEALPAKNPGQERQRGVLNYAIDQLNWDGVQRALIAYGGFSPAPPADGENVAEAKTTSTGNRGVPLAPLNAAAPALTAEFLEQMARLIEAVLPALGQEDARFSEQAADMLRAMRQPAAEITTVKRMLANFSHRLSFAAEEQAKTKETLLKLLHLIIRNIGELSLDDRWLQGQVDALVEASTPPLTLRRLDDVERRLRDVIFKQTEVKARALEVQERMRQMLGTFIERLSQMTESNSAYHGKMEEAVHLIEQAATIEDIAPVLQDVIKATATMTHDVRSTRDELQAMRGKAQTAAAEVAKLHQELDRASLQARHDALTGALNRQGLDEALAREVSTVRRKESALCLALLDIDNFKKINDRQGHEVGDAVLTHLAVVVRECMRPQDTLARYGGEEFVILLPDTPLDQGIEAMARLQRELSKRFFLTGQEKVFITFSAGVAQLAAGEDGMGALKRADQAMYLAKRAGKNRVVGA